MQRYNTKHTYTRIHVHMYTYRYSAPLHRNRLINQADLPASLIVLVALTRITLFGRINKNVFNLLVVTFIVSRL